MIGGGLCITRIVYVTSNIFYVIFPCTLVYNYVCMYIICCCMFFVYRSVSDGDIQTQERRLMQTMDMIISKKKRFVPFSDYPSGRSHVESCFYMHAHVHVNVYSFYM